jgi:hypothetical protein
MYVLLGGTYVVLGGAYVVLGFSPAATPGGLGFSRASSRGIPTTIAIAAAHASAAAGFNHPGTIDGGGASATFARTRATNSADGNAVIAARSSRSRSRSSI